MNWSETAALYGVVIAVFAGGILLGRVTCRVQILAQVPDPAPAEDVGVLPSDAPLDETAAVRAAAQDVIDRIDTGQWEQRSHGRHSADGTTRQIPPKIQERARVITPEKLERALCKCPPLVTGQLYGHLPDCKLFAKLKNDLRAAAEGAAARSEENQEAQ